MHHGEDPHTRERHESAGPFGDRVAALFQDALKHGHHQLTGLNAGINAGADEHAPFHDPVVGKRPCQRTRQQQDTDGAREPQRQGGARNSGRVRSGA